jgi:hypothetical protein
MGFPNVFLICRHFRWSFHIRMSDSEYFNIAVVTFWNHSLYWVLEWSRKFNLFFSKKYSVGWGIDPSKEFFRHRSTRKNVIYCSRSEPVRLACDTSLHILCKPNKFTYIRIETASNKVLPLANNSTDVHICHSSIPLIPLPFSNGSWRHVFTPNTVHYFFERILNHSLNVTTFKTA